MDKGTTHLIGQEWQNLMCAIRQSGGDGDGGEVVGGGKPESWRRTEDELQDVKRLKQRDMPLFGRCPETDLFYTVVCSYCSMVLMPRALREHIERRHGHECDDDSASKANVKLVKLSQVKPDRLRRIKCNSASPPDLTVTEDITKRCPKKLKSPEGTIPPELEPMLPSRPDKRKQKLVVNHDAGDVPELQPVVPLSPVFAPEKEVSTKDVPKKQKKKGERKADKVYDPNKHCGVVNDTGKPCLRSILCKVHQVALKRAVPNRGMPYDTLTKMLKSHSGEERVKAETRPKADLEEPSDTPFCIVTIPPIVKEEAPPDASFCIVTIPPMVKEEAPPDTPFCIVTIPPMAKEEPPLKRIKIEEEEIAMEESDPNQFALPHYLDALIEETLKNSEENEPLPLIPNVPKPEPVVRWNLESPPPPAAPSLPPAIVLDDVSWHSTHPKPMAINTFGCRLIGGLMSTCKKLDTLRKNLQLIWSPSTDRSGFNDVYSDSNSGNPSTKYSKKPTPNKTVLKKTFVAQEKPSMKRKRKTSLAATPSSASDIISGLLVGNSVPLQRSSAGLPAGVIPANGVPLRLFQGALPVTQQAPTFIQLNLCTPK